MIRHVVWDFDGTLIDSYPPMTGAFLEALAEAGVEETADHIGGMMKISAGTLYAYVHTRYGLGEAFLERYRLFKEVAERERMQPFPHAREVCAAIRESGRTNDLYTHRGVSAIAHLRRFGMDAAFRAFITGEDRFPRKPDPEALLSLMHRHGMRPDETVMVGDRDIDLLAGRNAGTRTCLFAPEGGVHSPHADFVIADLAQLPDLLR